MSQARTAPSSTTDLAAIVRTAYLDRANGVLEVRHSAGTENFFFRRGELFLDRDHSAAGKISRLLAAVPPGSRPAALAELRQEVEELARGLVRLHGACGELKDDRAMVVEVIGPLPTVSFVLELGVYGCNEKDLITRLGGGDVKLRGTDQTPALEQLPGLDPEMAQVLAGIERPTTPAELARGAGPNALGMLRGLVRLWAVGLVEPVQPISPIESGSGLQDVLSPRLLQNFKDRIADDLANRPLDLQHDEHRNRLADLLGRLGEMSHYDLLGVEIRAQEDEIFAAYNRLARVVHPSHSEHLGFQGKEEAMQVLFERATEAYLTLSDPRRRASYNNMAGIHASVEIDEAQRQEEKRNIAYQNYRRAASCMTTMDYSLAIDLLKEAARMDPKPEYLVLLAQAQSKNPNWQRHAVGSYRSAHEMKPEDPGILVGLAKVLEEMGEFDDARQQFGAALELMPDHPEALAGLERLGRGSSKGVSAGSFRSLFGGNSEE